MAIDKILQPKFIRTESVIALINYYINILIDSKGDYKINLCDFNLRSKTRQFFEILFSKKKRDYYSEIENINQYIEYFLTDPFIFEGIPNYISKVIWLIALKNKLYDINVKYPELHGHDFIRINNKRIKIREIYNMQTVPDQIIQITSATCKYYYLFATDDMKNLYHNNLTK